MIMSLKNYSNSESERVDQASFTELKVLLGESLAQLVGEFEAQGLQLLALCHRFSAGQQQAGGTALQQIRQMAHRLKGSAMSLHCLLLQAHCERLESIATPETAELTEYCDELEQCLHETLTELKQLL